MQLKEFNLILDIKKHVKQDYIEVVQGDYEVNILNITLYNELEIYNLANLNAEIAFDKPDGTTVVQDSTNGIIVAGNKIICTLQTNTIAAAGRVKAEVRVLESTKILTSSKLEFFVRKSIINDESVASANEFPLLQRLTNDVEGIIITEDARITAESNRQTAEQQRAITFTGYEDRVTTVEDDLVTHKAETMPHLLVNHQTGKTYKYGEQIDVNGKPQMIYEEVI